MLGDTYFITRKRMHPVLARGKFELLGRWGTVFVYRNKTAMSRAWMSDALAFKDNQAVYRRLKATAGKGLRSLALVVYPQYGQDSPVKEGVEKNIDKGIPIPAVKGRVSLVSHSAHSLVLQTEPSCKGLLVVSEMYYPGWEVYIDGKKKEILKTDLILRGVMLRGGQKRVEFRFRPGSLLKGAAVSLITLGLLLIYCAVLATRALLRRKKRRIEAIGDSTGIQ
jgi:hypothetical protein